MGRLGFFRPVEGHALSDELVLDAYRLARFYRCSPTEFLKLPLSLLAKHASNTQRMLERERDL